jgi:hypothetical protein
MMIANMNCSVATGEAWQQIMMSAVEGRYCQGLDGGISEAKGRQCGSDMTYPYFVSFVFLATFLVRFIYPLHNMYATCLPDA